MRFRITKQGYVTDVKARSSEPKLSEEGEIAAKSLPLMTPAMHEGKAVDVIYTLPITFTVEDKAEKRFFLISP